MQHSQTQECGFMNPLEKWALPNCSLGIPLRVFSDCLSLVGNTRKTISPVRARKRLLVIRTTECWS